MFAQAPASIAVRKAAPRLRAATFGDYDRIVPLQLQYGMPPRSRQQWIHLWAANPVYRRLGDAWQIGGILELEGELVGYYGNIPTVYHFQGRELLTAIGHTWVVESAYRAFSLLMLDQAYRQPNLKLSMHTTVNGLAGEPLLAYGAHPVPVGSWDTACFWVTRHRGFAESALRKKQVRCARVLSYPVGAALSIKDGFAASRPVRKAAHQVVHLSEFDDRFEVFWQELKRQRSHMLLADRSLEMLNWHYHFPVQRGELWIVAALESNAVRAYATFVRADDDSLELKRIRLVDFQSLSHPDILQPLVASALQRCEDERIHMMDNIGCAFSAEQDLREIAPYTRTLPAWCYFYRAFHPELEKAFSDAAVWNPSFYDGDASL